MECIEMNHDFAIFEQQVQLPCAPHTHDFLELAYIKRGWALHRLGNEYYKVQASDFVLVDFGQSHGYVDGSAELTVINCLFQPALIDVSLRDCRSFSKLLTGCTLGLGLGTGKTYNVRVLHDDRDEVARILEMLLAESARVQAGYYAAVRALVTLLAVQIVRRADYHAEREAGIEVQWIMEEIRRNVDRPHSLAAYAELFNMRPEQLGKKFMQQTGRRFSGYLRDRRMETASRLLLETEYPVGVIAAQCGYEDEKSFRAAFRAVTGMTPREYRRQNKKAAEL